ncbi:MAG: hypothetical protein JWM80_6317 [Cyanobacteria bacterium RYN_339]|nr:hypothetical protein [Cyanobacteria bacterium RYN_339]
MRVATWLFLAFTALYLFTGGGHFYASDDVQKLAVLDALADHHTVAIPDGWVRGAGGLRYAWFPLGASLVMLPGWLLGKLAALVLPVPAVFAVRFCVAMQNAVISAALVTLFFAACRRLGAPRGGALVATLGLGLGSLVWPYAKTAWSEPTTALALYGGLAALWLARERPRWLVVAGVGLALAVAIRQEFLLAALGAIAWWCWQTRGRGLLWLATPLALVGVAALAYDAVRYGTPFSFPSYHLPQKKVVMAEGRFSWSLRNFYQYTVSPNQGIFWYSPVTLACFGGFRGGVAGLLALSLGPLALFYMAGWGLSSWAWGLRYAYVFVPALVLPLAWAPRKLATPLVALGLGVQLLAVLHNPLELYERELARVPGLTIQQLMIQRAHAPLWLAAKDAPATLARGRAALVDPQPAPPGPLEHHQGLPDVWWLLVLLAPVPRALVAVVAALMALAGLVSAWALARALRAEARAGV